MRDPADAESRFAALPAHGGDAAAQHPSVHDRSLADLGADGDANRRAINHSPER